MAQNKSWTKYLPIAIVALLCIGILSYVLYVQSPVDQPSTSLTTFNTRAYVDDENVDSLLPLSLWTPKSTATFDEPGDYADITKYSETTASVVAGFISVDMSSYSGYWVQVDPDAETPFAEDWIYVSNGGTNGVVNIQAKDPTTDVNFNVLDGSMNEVTVADHQTDGNYTVIYDCPHYTTTAAQLHYGTGWDLTAAEFADLTATQQEDYYDEANWAGQFPLFDPNDYTYKTTLTHPNLASLTNAFAFKLTFNDSVSIVDGSATQVNFTLSDNEPFQVAVSGEVIYLVAYQPITFLNGPRTLGFEISYAANITLSDVDSGNLPILQSGNSFGTFVKLSDIAA